MQTEIALAKQGTFYPLVKKLMQNTTLCVNNQKFFLHELEIYLYTANHQDKYVHLNSDQLQYGKWYFHKYKNGTLKNGSFKGLDIVLGNIASLTYFGVLIRAIRQVDEFGVFEIIEGPCKVVNKIKDLTRLSLSELDALSWTDTNTLYLEINEHALNNCSIYTGPRIGLSDKYPEWKDLNYRFVAYRSTSKQIKRLSLIQETN